MGHCLHSVIHRTVKLIQIIFIVLCVAKAIPADQDTCPKSASEAKNRHLFPVFSAPIQSTCPREVEYICPESDSDPIVIELSKVFPTKYNSVSIANSAKGTICILLRVHAVTPDAVLDNINLDSTYRDYHITPISRSYNGRKWERVAGLFSSILKVKNCRQNQCTLEFPKEKKENLSRYLLVTFEHSLSFKEELSRFFTHTTFGGTKSMIENWKPSKDITGMANWVKDQIYLLAPTLHRVFYRQRTNHYFKNLNQDRNHAVIPCDPCKANSVWRNYTFDEFDAGDNWAAFTFSKLPDGRMLISKRGFPRTVVNKLRYHSDASKSFEPGNYNPCFRFEGRLGGQLHLKKTGGGDCIRVRGGNPPLYLPPDVLDDPSFVTHRREGFQTVQMPGEVTDENLFTYIPPVVKPNSDANELSLEGWRLNSDLQDSDGCAILRAEMARSNNVIGLMPDYASTGRVLRNAALVEYLENTLGNPVSDGGWKQKEMGATRCSNVRANYANINSCLLQTNRTVEGPICTYWGEIQENVVVCGSDGEIANKKDIDPLEMNIFRPWFNDGNLIWYGAGTQNQRYHVWEMVSLTAADQLRQRTAWALSQTFNVMVSSINDGWLWTEFWTHYYDIFVRNAFGNYRDVLRDVTYSRVMGHMLTYKGSRSSWYVERFSNMKGSRADENYAREFMQLFTIGLDMLNEDGTIMQRNGVNIPTYESSDVSTFARAWTGFDEEGPRGNMEGGGNNWKDNYVDPMVIDGTKRDPFPKADTLGGYIGDGYPLCTDLPPKQFLRKGATYRMNGSNEKADLDRDPSKWATNDVYRRRKKDPVLDSRSSLYKKLCNPSADGTCNFQVLTTLDENLECYGDECKLESVRRVKLVSNVGHVYIEYVKPPCVELPFGEDLVTIRRSSGSFATCANKKINDLAMASCCKDYSGHSYHSCLYSGERVSFDVSESRCKAQDNYPRSKICYWWRRNLKFERGQNHCTLPYDGRTLNMYWTDAGCQVRVKVNGEGFIALIHKSEKSIPTYFSLDSKNNNYFKVHWSNGHFPSPSNDCGGVASCKLGNGACHCDVDTVTERVFENKPESVEDIILKLSIGSPDPTSFDEGTYNIDQSSDDPFIVRHKIGNNAYSEHTVFSAYHHGKWRHFKNMRSVVKISDSGTTYGFRNPPHLLRLMNPTTRDAIDETEAVLDHFFYHPNTATFVTMKLIQRFGTSNPSPSYIRRVTRAFKEGRHVRNGVSFGTGDYGDLASTIAAIVLDEEVRNVLIDADPSAGSIREPTLSIFAFMRAMEFTKASSAPHLRIMLSGISQMPFSSSIFGEFSSDYAEPGSNFVTAHLTSPEAESYTPVQTIAMLNSLNSLIEVGLTECYSGFGERTIAHGYKNCINYKPDGTLTKDEHSRGYLAYKPNVQDPAAVIDDLSLLLTGGRLNDSSRRWFEEVFSKEMENTRNFDRAFQLAQRLFLLSPEFHSTGLYKPGEVSRPSYMEPESVRGGTYKAMIHLHLNGGLDGFNMLVPHSDCVGGKDLYAEYEAVRYPNALSKGSLLKINAASSSQICSTFGLHESIPFLQELYTEGDLSFLANVGVLNEITDDQDYKLKTKIKVGAHDMQRHAVFKNDIASKHPSRGVSGRMLDALKDQGFKSHGMSIGNGGGWTLSSYNAPRFTVSSSGKLPAYGEIPWTDSRDDILSAVNKEAKLGSSMFAELWSNGLQSGIEEYESLRKIINNADSATLYPTTKVGTQFETIGKIIKTAAVRGVEREVLFTEMHGWDHHFNLESNLKSYLGQIDEAIKALVAELKDLGKWKDTTLFITSDFGRSLTMNGNGGTDHGWANNYFVAGGSVKGGQILGKYPETLKNDNPLIFSGISIPTHPLDSVWNAIAEWMGVDNEEGLNLISPNRNSFPDEMIWRKDVMFDA